ncbi:MAG: NAD-dependent 4,6-dehydratase LegB [Clostridium sp.]
MNKILVTGAGGFIGSHLTEELVRRGEKVKALIHYNSQNSWGWLDTIDSHVLNEIEVIAGDVRDENIIGEGLKECSGVFHLAALIAIPYSYSAPKSYVDTNVLGTLNVLQKAKDNELERVIITSTSEVYGTAKYVPIDENHGFQGQSPYSASKIGGDRLGEAFYRSFNMPISIVRPFNTYGPRQSARAIIPTIITQLLCGNEEIKLGALTPTRDFNYVLDTVDGFIEIYNSKKTIGEEINIATGDEISINDLAAMLIGLINKNAHIICDEERVRPENSEVNRLLGSNEKIKNLTNWKDKYSLEEGLKRTIEWFKVSENLSKYRSNIYNK